MNGLRASIAELEKIVAGARRLANVELIVCPPATLIASFAATARGSGVLLGAQDCHALASGAYTGDISAEMLKDAGASAVIVGHSERRRYHAETDAAVREKVLAARRAGLMAIVCVGETGAQRKAGRAFEVVELQLEGSLSDELHGLRHRLRARLGHRHRGHADAPRCRRNTSPDTGAAALALRPRRGRDPCSLRRLGQSGECARVVGGRECRWDARRRREFSRRANSWRSPAYIGSGP